MNDDKKQLFAAITLPSILILVALWNIVPNVIPADIKDKLVFIILICFFGAIFFYVIFRAPDSDMVFSSDSFDAVNDAETFLSNNGIKTYVKNMSEYRNIMRYRGQPSLHVTNPEDRDKALQLLQRWQTGNNSDLARHRSFVHLYSPENDAELALLKSILDSEDINYFVKNDNFGSLEVGPRIGLFNAKMIDVQDDQYERASELLADYLEKTKKDAVEQAKEYSLFDKIRMVIEVLVFGWLMPGRRKTKKNDEQNE